MLRTPSLAPDLAKLSSAAFALLWMVGCVTVGPEYTAPQPVVPTKWHYQDPALMAELPIAVDWWTLFQDPLLEQIVNRAIEGNLSLKAALARIDESRALYGVASGLKMPGAGASADLARGRSAGATANLFSLAARVDYEIDLFGRVRRTLEAAGGELAASEEDARDVKIALCGEVGLRYLEIRTLQAQTRAVVDQIQALQESEKLVRTRARLGLASELDVVKAERDLAQLRTTLPPLRVAQQRTRSALTILLGQIPGALDAQLVEAAPIPLPPTTAAIGLPLDLARQRPDIRAAERRLAAQTARIGIATAALYPAFSLSGSLGASATEGDQLFKSDSGTWGIGVSVRQAIFAGGRLRNAIEAEKARTEQALIAYEAAVLKALHEVENAAYGLSENRIAEAELQNALVAANHALDFANKRYQEGLVDFQDVLDALAIKSQLEGAHAALRGASAAYFVNLYRSLGGGWQSPPISAETAASPAPAP